MFQTAIYNQTVTITEPEEGLDGETWVVFLFFFLPSCNCLFNTIAAHVRTCRRRCEVGTKREAVEYDCLCNRVRQKVKERENDSQQSIRSN